MEHIHVCTAVHSKVYLWHTQGSVQLVQYAFYYFTLFASFGSLRIFFEMFLSSHHRARRGQGRPKIWRVPMRYSGGLFYVWARKQDLPPPRFFWPVPPMYRNVSIFFPGIVFSCDSCCPSLCWLIYSMCAPARWVLRSHGVVGLFGPHTTVLVVGCLLPSLFPNEVEIFFSFDASKCGAVLRSGPTRSTFYVWIPRGPGVLRCLLYVLTPPCPWRVPLPAVPIVRGISCFVPHIWLPMH